MGDRANIALKQNQPDQFIYLYTHSSGTELPITLHAALKRGRGRWNDAPYLGRIIFSEMIKSKLMELTGYGVSTDICDGGSRVLIVDSETETVKIGDRSYSFDEFISIDFDSEENDGEDPWDIVRKPN